MYSYLIVQVATKNPPKNHRIKLMVEVGMAVQTSIQTRVRYMLCPYCFSSNGISVKSSRDVRICNMNIIIPTTLVCTPYFTHQ